MQGDIPHLRIGPNPKGLGVKLSVKDGPTTVVCDGRRAQTRLLLARSIHGGDHDSLVKEYVYHLDEAIRRPWPAAKSDFLRLVKAAGVEISYDREAAEQLEQAMLRMRARYSRTLPVPQENGEIEWRHTPGSIDPAHLAKTKEALRYLGWDKMLYPFAAEGVAEMATKRDVLIAMGMGTTKTRTSLALTEVHRYLGGVEGPTIIIGLRKHLSSWAEEFAKVPLLTDQYGHKPYEVMIDKKDKPTFRAPFIIISLDRLKRLSEEEYAEVQRVAATGQIIVDEIYVCSSAHSLQSQALRGLSARHHVGLSGSPIRGYPDSAFLPLAWTLRGGSAALPDYPLDRQGSQKRWNAKYVSYAVSEDGGRKKIPYLKNEEDFYAMIEPLVYRRLRNEPDLIEVLGSLTLEEETVEVELDPQHIKFYLAVLKRFSEWYLREVERRRAQGKQASIPAAEILVKLGFLIRGVSTPWRMKDPGKLEGEADDFEWPEYPRQPTAILRAAMDRAATEVEEGYQVIIFADNQDGLNLMRETLVAEGHAAEVIHGGVPHAQRDEIIARVRGGDTKILCASYGTLAEGINLAACSRVILTEYNWSPSTVKQAVARITRPDQKYTPKAIYLTAPGTIQDYVRRLCALKQESMDAALDRISQTSTGEDVPDVQQYAASLVGSNHDPEQVSPRSFEIDLEGQG